MKKFLTISFKALKIIAGLLLILYIVVYVYVSVNKKSIIAQVTAEIGKKIAGNVSVGDVELSFFRQFPKISVLLNNVRITDSMFARHQHALFSAKRLFARISITKLIKKESPLNGLTIDQGEFYLYTDSSGYSNMYLLKQKKDSAATASSSSEDNELKSVSLKDVRFVLDDRNKLKLHNYFINDMEIKLDEDPAAFLFDADGNVMIHSMAFNLPRGGFLSEQKFTGKFEFRFDKQLHQLQFDSINIELSGQPFNLSGRFDLQGDHPQFSLRAHTYNIMYEAGKEMLPKRLDSSLSLVALDKPLDVDVNVLGPLKGGEPLIYVNWVAKETQLKTPFLDFDNASFTGYFMNEVVKGAPRDDSNSVINVDHFSAVWHGLPLAAGNIRILNLFQPLLTADLASDFSMTKLNEVVGSNFLQFQSGQGSVNLSYKGPIIRNDYTNSFLNGVVTFKDGTILYQPRDVVMKNLNAELIFKNSDVFVKDMRCTVLNNKILMQGQAKNLLTFINTDPAKAIIDWNISTPSLNLGAFTFLLKPGKKVAVAMTGKNNLASATKNIDAVLDRASLHVNLDATSLVYKKFEASKVNADISLLENKYLINNVSMNHAGGSVRMNGSLIGQKGNSLLTTIKASMDNVDVSKVLTAFENFGQDAILDKNLDGKLTTKVEAVMTLSDDGKILPGSMVSTVDFSLKDGALINFEPVKKMQNILFKNRDFDNIRFAELKDRLEIKNRDIKINRMEIQSTVLSFFVEGIFSMKGNTDISIQVPWNNLRKRGADYNPENVGTDKKAKKSVYLRGRPGSDGNINFKLDIFNKFKKEKEG